MVIKGKKTVYSLLFLNCKRRFFFRDQLKVVSIAVEPKAILMNIQ